MTPDQIYQILLGGLGLFGGIWIRSAAVGYSGPRKSR